LSRNEKWSWELEKKSILSQVVRCWVHEPVEQAAWLLLFVVAPKKKGKLLDVQFIQPMEQAA